MTSGNRLTAREFEILTTLVSGPRHGYAIIVELRSGESGGRVLGPGTLYRVLKDLSGRGLIGVTTVAEEETDGPPRRYYQLTARGRREVAEEGRRLAALLQRVRPLLRGER